MRHYLPIAVVVTIGVSVTIGGFMTARLAEQREVETAFGWRATERITAINRIVQAQLQSIRTVKVFLDTAGDLDRRRFRAFAKPLSEITPAIQALGWVPRIIGADRHRSEQAAVEEGLSGFTLREHGAEQQMVPASLRMEYFPVYYIEPHAGNESALGFDLASDPVLHRAMVRARDEGHVVTSARVILVQEAGDQHAILTFDPRYRDDVPMRTVQERRRHLVGFVLGVSRVDDLLAAALSYFEPAGIDVAIVDASAPPAERLLAFHSSRTRSMDEATDYETVFAGDLPLRSDASVDVGGRSWSVICAPTPGFMSAHTTPLRWVILCTGLLLTALFARYLQILASRRAATEALIETDRALRESERRYRTLFENAPEAVVVLDVERQRFVDVNDNAIELFNMSREELLNAGPPEVSPTLQPDGRSSREVAGKAIERALAGEEVVFEWTHRDSEGRDIPCEIRLVRFPSTEHRLVRGSVIDISKRKESERRQALLLSELDHRVKNTLATVLALAKRTAATTGSLDEFQSSFAGRIGALARVHEFLAASNWSGVPLGKLVRITLEPFMRSNERRVTLDGDDIMLTAYAASPVCITLHELTTNAAKYGALSTPGGALDVAWGVGGDHVWELRWRESGGPRCEPATRSGFGISMIKEVIEYEIDGTVDLDFRPQGLACTIRVPLNAGSGAAAENL